MHKIVGAKERSTQLTPDTRTLTGLVDIALAISEERGKMLAEMKKAIQAEDHERVIQLAKRICGVEDDGNNH
jgi:hypothetical protein